MSKAIHEVQGKNVRTLKFEALGNICHQLANIFLHWWAESTVLWTSEYAKRQTVSKRKLEGKKRKKGRQTDKALIRYGSWQEKFLEFLFCNLAYLHNHTTKKKKLKPSTEHLANRLKNVELLLKGKDGDKILCIKFSHKELPNPIYREIKAIQADLELSLRTGHAHDPNYMLPHP